MRHATAKPPSLIEGLFFKRLIMGVISFLTLVDLFAAQAILPTLAASYKVSPAAMAFAVNASTFRMAAAGIVIALLSYRIDHPAEEERHELAAGYRRCPGEQLNIAVFSDFLRKVWADKIEFDTLGEANPAKIPIGPANVIDDNIGFRRGGGTSL
jgi:hypothetical protein